MTRTVAVLGGGVAGMSAAHHLAERGFKVTVYEAGSAIGGKAKGFAVPGTSEPGRAALPGEHGFRFFPGFYWHLPDTMKGIPYWAGGSVFDNLVDVDTSVFLRSGAGSTLRPQQRKVQFPTRPPQSLAEATEAIFDLADDLPQLVEIGITPEDGLHFWQCLQILLTSCRARRFDAWEHTPWADFVTAGYTPSPRYKDYLAYGLTRRMVAAKGDEISARTAGYITLQLLYDAVTPGASADRVLNGPTNDVWLDPWTRHLDALCVDFQFDSTVDAFECQGSHITGVTVKNSAGAPANVQADYYVAALPVDVMEPLCAPLTAADPQLANLRYLKTDWMVGMQYFLPQDVPIARSHVSYFDEPYALTSISQQQFWAPQWQLRNMFDGSVGGVLSVCICDWRANGKFKYTKPAKELTKDQLISEVWAQLQDTVNTPGATVLDQFALAFLDPGVQPVPPPGSGWTNATPLFINTPGSWANRPTAGTSIDNLVLASDYVRTYSDLATMESANEAARRAVNEIIPRSGQGFPKCELRPLYEPPEYAVDQAIDLVRYNSGQPNAIAESLGIPS